VLDFGQVAAGNFCGAILGYFGADVIKVGNQQAAVMLQMRHRVTGRTWLMSSSYQQEAF